jgi:hypothetical protein
MQSIGVRIEGKYTIYLVSREQGKRVVQRIIRIKK